MGIEGGKFLDRKYQDLTGSRAVERAVIRARSDESRDSSPHSREERVEAYLSRLENIIDDDHGRRLLKRKLIEELTIDTDNQEIVEKIARGLYEAEKRIAINQGRQADVMQLDEIAILAKYRTAVFEKQEIQEKSLTAWLDYLAQNDADYPTWFQYFVVRSLGKMGTLNKEKGEYNKRTEYTVAPFPELNSEALGFVYRMLSTGIGSHEFIPEQDQTPEEQQITLKKREQLLNLIEKQDFAKLYVFAQLETAGNSNRESLVGEWVKYEKGSDPNILEVALRGKGTGWCTAQGSARKHLEHGDFYVYFTKGSKGRYSEPRIAIRMKNNRVEEVRGVNHRQEIEPSLIDIAQSKYKELPGGEAFEKKSVDMQRMTTLVQRQEKGTVFTIEDLRFLYEVNGFIEGFGYEADPRIIELRNRRDRQKDIETLCDCSPEAIAYNFSDIALTTQVYCCDTGKKHSFGDFRKLSFLDFREEKNQKNCSKLYRLMSH